MDFWRFQNKASGEAELWIEGDIVDDGDVWIYQCFGEPCAAPNKFRKELEKCEGKSLTVYIDSYGGSVYAAAGIYDALKKRKGGTRCMVTGKAMSAATVIAMAGDTVVMSPTAMFMIHDPLCSVSGYAVELRKVAALLDTVKETIINAYVLKTGNSREHISRLMEDETYMSAKRALKEGFIDEIALSPGESPEVVNFAFPRMAVMNVCKADVQKLIALAPAEPPGPAPEGVPAPEPPEDGGARSSAPEAPAQDPEGPSPEDLALAESARQRKNQNILKMLEVTK